MSPNIVLIYFGIPNVVLYYHNTTQNNVTQCTLYMQPDMILLAIQLKIHIITIQNPKSENILTKWYKNNRHRDLQRDYRGFYYVGWREHDFSQQNPEK